MACHSHCLLATGAVAVRLRVYDSPLCVVCSHLASGDQEGDELKRNADYADILKRCQFLSDGDLAATGVGTPAGGCGWAQLTAPLCFSCVNCASCCWCGSQASMFEQ